MRSFVQCDGLSYGVGAPAQPALPELMADDGDGGHFAPRNAALNGLLLLRRKSAPQLRRRAECGEEITGDKDSGDFHCAIAGGQRHIMYIVSSQTGKAPRLRAPSQEISVRDRGFSDALAHVALPELRQAVGFPVWKRAQDDRIHHAEERRVQSDAERQSNYGYQRKARPLHQHSRAVTQVLPKVEDHIFPPRGRPIETAVKASRMLNQNSGGWYSADRFFVASMTL